MKGPEWAKDGPWRERPGVYLFVGRRFMGKTTLARAFTLELLEHGGRQVAIISDPQRNYLLPPNADGSPSGKQWASVQEFRKSTTGILGGASIPRWNTFVHEEPVALAELAAELAERGARVVFVVDEMDRAYPPSVWLGDPKRRPGVPWMPGALHRIVTEGRHIGAGVDLVGTVRTPTALHTELGGLVDALWCFQITSRSTVAWLEETCGAGWGVLARQLPEHHSLYWTPREKLPGGQGRKQLDMTL